MFGEHAAKQSSTVFVRAPLQAIRVAAEEQAQQLRKQSERDKPTANFL
jgi:hypothetical protein